MAAANSQRDKLKRFKPVTPGTRGLVLVSRKNLHAGGPERSLVRGISETGGRNNKGRITARHRGGRAKRLYRMIDFKRQKFGIEACVERIEYDPNRTAYIALLRYSDGVLTYILAPKNLSLGDKIFSGEGADIKLGNALCFKNIPAGTLVHNVELKPGKGGQIARSAGNYANFVGLSGGYAQLRLPSGEFRLVRQECMATIGVVSNADNSNQNFGKAGRIRHKGFRPHVRGVAMNPIDHPHGGGEGKSSGGRHPCSPTGKLAKGVRTRHNKATNKYIVRRRRK